jgi:Flp pilus assembly protein TadD
MTIASMKVGWRTVIPTRHPFTARHCRTRPSLAAAALGLALFAGGCQNISTLTTAAAVAPQPQPQPLSEPQPQSQLQPPPVVKSEAEWRTEAEALAGRYRAKPDDPATALAYAQALRGSGQRTQAVSVLQQASFKHPHNTALLGAYGRALSDMGNFEQALEVLARAHTPEQPDWRILSAQGAVLDQLGRHDEAQRYYSSALRIKPDDPGVLSNLGLSYALAKDLKNAEATLRRATAGGGADPRVRQNLALVVGLQGRFGEAESIARADLPSNEAAANVAYLRQMLAQQGRPENATAAHARLRRSNLVLPPRKRGEGVQVLRIRHLSAITLMIAGPRITMNNTGRKNTIIGTVSCGGRAAAFFSAAVMR